MLLHMSILSEHIFHNKFLSPLEYIIEYYYLRKQLNGIDLIKSPLSLD